MRILNRLSDNLLSKLKTAEEIWLAVALINLNGLEFILDNTPEDCKHNFLIGIDLPTDPKALKKLNKLQFQLNSNLKVRLFSHVKEFFHPKLYLIKSNNFLSGFLGSANCTNGGLNKNIELTIQIDDQQICEELKHWFSTIFDSDKAKPLTTSFIKEYQAQYLKRQKRKSEEEKIAKIEKKKLNEDFKATLKEKEKFIRILNEYRQQNYENIKRERKNAVDRLRESLDYPNFNNINSNSFFSIHDLGHIIEFPKPTIIREINRFSELLKVLCNEQIDIAQRYDNALEGNLKIRGVNEALITKILAIHANRILCKE